MTPKEKASKLYTDAYTRWCYELSHDKNVTIAKDICLYICREVLSNMGTDDREAYEIGWWSEVKTILEKSNHNDLYKTYEQ